MRRWLSSCIVLALAAPVAGTQVLPPDAELLTGIRQVNEGDFETAVVTLEGVVKRLQGNPSRTRDLADANVYLGVAELALDKRDSAKAHFGQALATNPQLRFGPERFSPKVLAAFEEARTEAARAAPGSAAMPKGKSAAPLIIAGGAAAVATGVILATRGGGDDTMGGVSFANARFAMPQIECPDGSVDRPIAYGILVDGTNATGQPVTITFIDTVLFVTASPGIPGEVGFRSNLPSTFVPTRLDPGVVTPMSIQSTLLCGNAAGGDGRFNEWRGEVTVTTTAGVSPVINTADRLRVNIP